MGYMRFYYVVHIRARERERVMLNCIEKEINVGWRKLESIIVGRGNFMVQLIRKMNSLQKIDVG